MATLTLPYGQADSIEVAVKDPRDVAEVRAAVRDVVSRNKLDLDDPALGGFLDRAYGKQSGSSLAKAFSPIAAVTDTIGAAITPLMAGLEKANIEQEQAYGITQPGLLGTDPLKRAMAEGDFRTVRDIRAREAAPQRLQELADSPVELAKTFANAFSPWQSRRVLDDAPEENKSSLAKLQAAVLNRDLTPGENLGYALLSPENFVPIERIASIPQALRGMRTATAARELGNLEPVFKDADTIAREVMAPAREAKTAADTAFKQTDFENTLQQTEVAASKLTGNQKTAEDLLKEKLALERSVARGERTNTLRKELRARYKNIPDQNLTWQQYKDKYSILEGTDREFKEYQRIIKEKAPDKYEQLAKSRKLAEASIPRDADRLRLRMSEIDDQLQVLSAERPALEKAVGELRSSQASKALELSDITDRNINIPKTIELKREAPLITELAGKQLTPQTAEAVSKQVAPLAKAAGEAAEEAATSGPKLKRLAQNILKEAQAEQALNQDILAQARAGGKLLSPRKLTPMEQVFDTAFSNIRPEGSVLKSIGTSAKYLQDLTVGSKVVATQIDNKLQALLKEIDTKIANIPAQDVYTAHLARLEARGPQGLSAAGRYVYDEFQRVADYAKNLIQSNGLEMLDKNGKVVPFQSIEVFAPRRMSPEYNQAVKLVKSGAMNIDRFANEFGFASLESAKDAIRGSRPADALFASLKSRGSQNLSPAQRQFLDTSTDIWKQYASDLSHAVGSQTMYGGAQGRVLQAIEAATKSAVQAGKATPKDLKRVQDYIELLRGGQKINNEIIASAVNLSRSLANFQIGPSSILWQLLQGGMSWSVNGTKAFAGALKTILSGKEDDLTKALGIGLDFDTAGGFRRAAGLDNVLESEISKLSEKYLDVLRIGKFDLIMRKVARLSGANRAQELFDVLKKSPKSSEAIRFFNEFAPGVDITAALKRGHMVIDELAEAGLRMDREINFWQEAGSLPAIMTRIPGLGIFFKTAYLQTLSVKKLILDEAVKGNLFPALKYALVSAAIGETSRGLDSVFKPDAKEKTKKKDEQGVASRLGEDLLAGTGIVGSIYQGAKYRGLEGAFSSALGQNPLGVAKNVGQLGYSIAQQAQLTDIMPLVTGFAGKNLMSNNPAQAEAAFRTLKDAAAMIGIGKPIKQGAKLMEDKYKKERKAKEKK